MKQFPLGNLVTLDLLCEDPCRESPVVGIPVVENLGGESRDLSLVVKLGASVLWSDLNLV